MPARRLRALLDQVAGDRVLLRLHRVVHGAPATRIAQLWIKACSHQALGLCDATPACRIEKCRVPERVHRRNVRFRLQQHFQGVRTLGRRGQHQGRDSLRVDRTYEKRDKSGTIVHTGTTVYDRTLPEPDATWNWNLAPLGENDRTLSTGLVVGAWHLR